MTTVTVLRSATTATSVTDVTLTDAAPLDYNLAGRLRPHRGRVTVTTEGADTRFEVSLDAKNAHGIVMHGVWAWPRATSLPASDYGHGGCGLIPDLPSDLLGAMSSASGANLTELTDSTQEG